MRKLVLSVILAVSPLALQAGHDDYRTVYASVEHVEPVYERVAYHRPQEYCREETVARRGHSATAPILGAIIGGAIGNGLGHNKSNKKVGTFVGAALGATIASDVARRNHSPHLERVQRCEIIDETAYRDEVVGYDVTYRYHGRRYHARLPYHPGERLEVSVNVTPVR